MPRIKCDWDVCKHFNWETGYCKCKEEIVLKGLEITRETMSAAQVLECQNFEDFKEGDG